MVIKHPLESGQGLRRVGNRAALPKVEDRFPLPVGLGFAHGFRLVREIHQFGGAVVAVLGKNCVEMLHKPVGALGTAAIDRGR